MTLRRSFLGSLGAVLAVPFSALAGRSKPAIDEMTLSIEHYSDYGTPCVGFRVTWKGQTYGKGYTIDSIRTLRGPQAVKFHTDGKDVWQVHRDDPECQS